MKTTITILTFLFAFTVQAQISNNNDDIKDVNEAIIQNILETISELDCDQYRDIMDQHIETLDFDRFFIVGSNDKYYNPGMSTHFIKAPKVANSLSHYPPRNPIVVSLEKAHVYLYHCDVKERKLLDMLQDEINKAELLKLDMLKLQNSTTQTESSTNISLRQSESDEIVLFPNPTTGDLNIKNTGEKINRILIFNNNGKLVLTPNPKDRSINLSGIIQGTYYILLVQNNRETIRKIILK